MSSICLNFVAHLPYAYRRYHFFDVGVSHDYYDLAKTQDMVREAVDECFIPANELFFRMIDKYKGRFTFSITLSGVLLEMLENYSPQVLDSFRKLVDTGCVEITSTPYYHSLASMVSSDEFRQQIAMHYNMVNRLFGYEPVTFVNTGLVYADYIGEMLSRMGFRSVITEGAKHVLGWRSPNYLYCNPVCRNLKIFFRNQSLSDDISIRFSNHYWSGFPLTASKFSEWLYRDPNHQCVSLVLDYTTLGMLMPRQTGIFEFFEHLPEELFRNTDYEFKTPRKLSSTMDSVSPVYVPNEISSLSGEKDTTPWLGNDLQKDFFKKLYSLDERIKRLGDESLLEDWRILQMSDNMYSLNLSLLSEKRSDVEEKSLLPYESYINLMNIFSDLEMRIRQNVMARKFVRKRVLDKKTQHQSV